MNYIQIIGKTGSDPKLIKYEDRAAIETVISIEDIAISGKGKMINRNLNIPALFIGTWYNLASKTMKDSTVAIKGSLQDRKGNIIIIVSDLMVL